MYTKIVSSILALTILFTTLSLSFSQAAYAAETSTNIEQLDPKAEEPQYIDPNENVKLMGVVITALFTAIVSTFVTESFVLYRDWINRQWQKLGGETYQCSDVKINDHTFNHRNRDNWVGDGYSNTTTRVRDLQQTLKEAGYNPGTVDGLWGTKTKAATKEMQYDLGVTADGVVGTKTWAKMGGLKSACY